MPIKTRYKLQLGRFAHAPQETTTAPAPAPLAHPSTESAASQPQARPAEEGKAPQGGGEQRRLNGDGIDFWLDHEPGDTVALLYPRTDRAHVWADNHLDPEAMMFGDAIVIENRFIAPIVQAIEAHGLRLEVN